MYTQPAPPHTSFYLAPYLFLSLVYSLALSHPAHKGVNGNFYSGEEDEAKKRDLLKRDKNFSKQWKGNFKMLSRKKKTLTFEGFTGKGGREGLMMHTQSYGSCGDG